MPLAVVFKNHRWISIFNKGTRITQLDQQYGFSSLSLVASCLVPIFSKEQLISIWHGGHVVLAWFNSLLSIRRDPLEVVSYCWIWRYYSTPFTKLPALHFNLCWVRHLKLQVVFLVAIHVYPHYST